MKQLFSKSFILNSSFYQIDKNLTNNFTELIRYQIYWRRSLYKIDLHLSLQKFLNIPPVSKNTESHTIVGTWRLSYQRVKDSSGGRPPTGPFFTSAFKFRHRRKFWKRQSGRLSGLRPYDVWGFAVSCRIGWLISHSHDYIDETECIYIRARTAPRVSDWVQYLENKKLPSSTLSTLSSWFFPSLSIFFAIFLILATISHK